VYVCQCEGVATLCSIYDDDIVDQSCLIQVIKLSQDQTKLKNVHWAVASLSVNGISGILL